MWLKPSLSLADKPSHAFSKIKGVAAAQQLSWKVVEKLIDRGILATTAVANSALEVCTREEK